MGKRTTSGRLRHHCGNGRILQVAPGRDHDGLDMRLLETCFDCNKKIFIVPRMPFPLAHWTTLSENMSRVVLEHPKRGTQMMLSRYRAEIQVVFPGDPKPWCILPAEEFFHMVAQATNGFSKS